jgi:cytochrome d ubiquinol oxidase subunit II
MDLNWVWFVVVALLLAIYAATDGYDLGIGVLYPFLARNDEERAALRQSIGPVWDGNEVWLLVLGGALFGAFPLAYADAMSAFYLAVVLILLGLILRAVSIEYRSHGSSLWALAFDAGFFVGSLVPALLFGVAVGNLLEGIGLRMAQGGPHATSSSIFSLLSPYTLLVGLTGLVMFLMVGASWAALKTSGDLRRRSAKARSALQIALVVFALLTTAATARNDVAGQQLDNALGTPAGWIMLALLIGGVVYARRAMMGKNDWQAFVGSVVTIAGLVGVGAAGLYPALIRSDGNEGTAVTVTNAASGHTTQVLMLVVALVVLPVVIAYAVYVNRVFSGRVVSEPEETGY